MIKNYYKSLLSLILTFGAFNVMAQTAEDSVKMVINSMFEGMKKTDTALIRSAFTSKPILQTVVVNRTGRTMVVTDAIDSFLVSISRPHTDVYDERISFSSIKIDGDLASVWTPYKFYVGDKFSHCGANSFQLVRLNGLWKIQYLIDTRRRQGCE